MVTRERNAMGPSLVVKSQVESASPCSARGRCLAFVAVMVLGTVFASSGVAEEPTQQPAEPAPAPAPIAPADSSAVTAPPAPSPQLAPPAPLTPAVPPTCEPCAAREDGAPAEGAGMFMIGGAVLDLSSLNNRLAASRYEKVNSTT